MEREKKDRQTDGQKDRQKDRQTDGQMERKGELDRRRYSWIYET